MKDETINMMKLGVSMILFSGLLTYVIFTFVLGKSIGNDFLTKTQEIQVQTEAGPLRELSGIETIMPAATAFSMFEYQYKNIRQITCYVCDPINGEVRTMNQNLCISEHLEGYVKILVEYNEAYGLYDITIWPS